VLAHKKLVTCSKIKGSNKQHKDVKTRFFLDTQHDAERNKTIYKARMVAEGFNHVPGREFDETWAPIPNAGTSRALFSVAAASRWDVHHVDLKTALINVKIDNEMYIKLPDAVESVESEDVRWLNLAMHGTKHAGRLWGIKLNE